MPDNSNFINYGDRRKLTTLHICVFSPNSEHLSQLTQLFHEKTDTITSITQKSDLISFVKKQQEKIDCLIFFYNTEWEYLLLNLRKSDILLPIVIIEEKGTDKIKSPKTKSNSFLYHSGEVRLNLRELLEISQSIDLAIKEFINLNPSCPIVDTSDSINNESKNNQQNLLPFQQSRLAEKLKERLGYLGVYYKRDSKDFYSQLTPSKQKALVQQLQVEYRQIILLYFEENPQINDLIDGFVYKAFFSDFSVSQVLEIHMELMEEFGQQLKLEGRSEEILLDYRLTLIDVIAHLCEMYRRSIPREDIS